MKPLSGYARYQTALAKFASAYMDPASKAKMRGEQYLRPTDKAFASVFNGFTEIANTLEALELAEVLIGLPAPKSRRIKKDEYLKFLIGAYLQEVYILEKRLSAYATKISRLYKSNGKIQSLANTIRVVFDGITRTRGSHVHSQRYSDQKLDMLSGFALISASKQEFGTAMHSQYKFVQREWRKTVQGNNAATRTFLDNYCDQLFPHISRDGDIFLPRTGRGGPAHATKREA